MEEKFFLPKKDIFSYDDLKKLYSQTGKMVSDRQIKYEIKKMMDKNKIARVGRNQYCLLRQDEMVYEYQYSDFAINLASCIIQEYPFVNFSISELIQLNEFINHQIGKNVYFLSIEEDVLDYIFESLKEKYPGKVLIEPSVEMFHKYWSEEMIVISKLVSEAPKGKKQFWNTELEKFLVDLYVEDLWRASVAESEVILLYESAFEKYVIDESRFFRYARRRGAEIKIKKFIEEQTTVRLRLR